MRILNTVIISCAISCVAQSQEHNKMTNEVKSLLVKSVEAHGGAQKLDKLNMCQLQHEITPYENGKPQLDQRFISSSNFFGDKRYIDNYINKDFTSRIVATEKDLWAYDNKGVEIPVPNENRIDGCKALRQTYLSNPNNLLKDDNISIRLLDDVNIGDVKCKVLEVSCFLIKEKTEVYFDNLTSLITRTSSSSSNKTKAIVVYTDYVDFDGQIYPTRVLLYSGDQLLSDNRLRKVKFIDKPESSIFLRK